MKRKLEEKLFNDFPLLYRSRKKGLQESLLGFGIETSDGWFDLLYELSSKLTNIINNTEWDHCANCYTNKKEHKKTKKDCPGFVPYIPEVSQIKSKYAGLRYYIHGATDEMDKLINEAERKSYTTCEECGSPGSLISIRMWYYTLCPKCHVLEEVRRSG